MDTWTHQLSSLANVHVLFVDDSDDERELFPLRFGRCGLTVTTAGTVEEALDALARIHPDVIFSDLWMPNADGYDLIREVRRRAPDEDGLIPVVAISGLTTAETVEGAIASGFNAFLPKPYTEQAVLDTIARLSRQIGEQRALLAALARQRTKQKTLRDRLESRQIELRAQRARLMRPRD